MKAPHTLLLCVPAIAAAAHGTVSFESARELYEAGLYDDAQIAFQALASNGENGEASFHLGLIALQQNDPPRAIEHLTKAVSASPRNSAYHHRLGDAYGRLAQAVSIFSAFGAAKNCRRAYERAVEFDPDNLDARLSLFLFYRDAPALIGGGMGKAAAEAAAIKARDPERGRIAFAVLHAAEKQYDQAQTQLAAIRPVEPASVHQPSAYLSDVKWASARVGWAKPARNHSWEDETSRAPSLLIVHGRLYAKGLHASAPSRYVFSLAGQWTRFTTRVGLREGADDGSAAVFIVRGDGRELYRSPQIRVNASAPASVGISGIRTLELITEADNASGESPPAIWAEPAIHR